MHRDAVPEHQGVLKRRPRVPDLHCQQCPCHPELRRAPSLRRAGVDRVRRIHGQHGRGKALFEEAADAMVEVGSPPHASNQDTRSRRHAQDQVPVLASRPLQPGKLKSGNGPNGCLTPELLAVPKRVNFKHAAAAVFRNFEALALAQVEAVAETVSRIVDDVAALWQRERPGRSYPRVSRKPRSKWSRRGKVAAAS